MMTVASLAVAAPAGAAVLYDGSLGTTPQAQGSLSYFALPGTATETVADGATTLDTTVGSSNAGEAGFSNHVVTGTPVTTTFPALNPAAGFDLSFTARIDAEAHATNDRAGFSVILLGSDHVGVELGFWTNEVFAQSAAFTHAEQTATFDPTAFHSYDLRIAGMAYALSADGTTVLTGSTRDYSVSFGSPYTLPNYLFLGDDTTSARGTADLSRVAIAVPEPATIGLMFAGGLLLGLRRRPKGRSGATLI